MPKVSQKYMGKGQLINRLASQVGSRKMAIGLLIKRGDLMPDGKTFTAKGAKKNAMTAEERAIAREVKESGRRASDYKYSKSTNRATLKK
jgi:hypothetical protein